MIFDDSKVSFEIESKPVSTGYGVTVTARYDGADHISGSFYCYFPFYTGDEAFRGWPEYADMTFEARCKLRDALELCAELAIEDDGIDPYDGDPRNEVADLATKWGFAECAEGEEQWVSAEYHEEDMSLVVEGPISLVLPVLRAAHGLA